MTFTFSQIPIIPFIFVSDDDPTNSSLVSRLTKMTDNANRMVYDRKQSYFWTLLFNDANLPFSNRPHSMVD